MQVDTALLCDAATVREGLLNVLGGGITSAYRPEFPAPLEMELAIRLKMHPTEIQNAHKVEILLQDEDGNQVTRAEIGFQPTEEAHQAVLPPGEEVPIPITWDFPARPAIPHPGRYSFEILVDGTHRATVPFTAIEGEQA
jgi:Family of unknown function (DUF6941)